MTGARRVSRSLLRAVAKHFGGCACGSGSREHGYQQQKTGYRGAEKTESPTKRSILLPCCCQTPCLSLSSSVLEILSSGQYVGRIDTVHPRARNFSRIIPICRSGRMNFLRAGANGNPVSNPARLEALPHWAHPRTANHTADLLRPKCSPGARGTPISGPPGINVRPAREFRVPALSALSRHGVSSLSNGDQR